jgi:hypothetical protein
MKRRKPARGTPGHDREFKQYLELLKSMQAFRSVWPERLKFFAHVLTRLSKVSAGDGQWTACCPAHADSSPSLSITINAKGDVLVYCFRGCSFADICRELNLSAYEMYDNSCASEPIRPSLARNNIIAQTIPADPKWSKMHQLFLRTITSDQVEDLAHHLKVSAEALTALEVGWSADDQAWTFPEFNGFNEICGILRRFPDSQKLVVQGGKRGLTLPTGWREKQTTLHICEGQSDVAAALSKGINAIGRPGKTAGLRNLAQVCRDFTQAIVVVADNDNNDDGRQVQSFVRQLSNQLQKEIGIFRPPQGFKDLRDFLTSGVAI